MSTLLCSGCRLVERFRTAAPTAERREGRSTVLHFIYLPSVTLLLKPVTSLHPRLTHITYVWEYLQAPFHNIAFKTRFWFGNIDLREHTDQCDTTKYIMYMRSDNQYHILMHTAIYISPLSPASSLLVPSCPFVVWSSLVLLTTFWIFAGVTRSFFQR